MRTYKATTKDSLIVKAQAFAVTAHHALFDIALSKRASLSHLQEVADLVRISGGSDEEIAAAWLHGSVESTSTTVDEISKKFGRKVGAIVATFANILPKDEPLLHLAEEIPLEQASTGVRRVTIADQTSVMRLFATDAADINLSERRRFMSAAKSIARKCRGTSPLLDGLFIEACQKVAN